LFEADEIVFRPRLRGGLRLKVPLRMVRVASAEGGVLRLQWGESMAELQIGAAAAKWLEKLKNPKTRLEKLGIKAGQRVALVGEMEDGFADELAAHGAHLLGTPTAKAPADVIFFAVESRQALGKLAILAKQINKNGAIWVIRPKGSAAIGERDVFEAAKAARLVDIKVVAFSMTHSGAKLVIPVDKR